MARLLRTSQALQDLDDIWDYIAQDNVQAADKLLDQFHERFRLLSQHPQLGEQQRLLADGAYRRFVHGNYVIYYRPEENGILILRILHGARDLDADFMGE